jgi:hypothetical protein
MDTASDRKWIKHIAKVVEDYNSAKHSKIKMAPNEVNAENEKEIFQKIYDYDHLDRNKFHKRAKFKVNDSVRISKKRGAFDKSYLVNYSYEVFKIRKVLWTNPVSYLLEDFQQQPIIGAFSEFELKRSDNPNLFLVEKVIAKKKGKVFVKYLGFSSEHNEWISEKNII